MYVIRFTRNSKVRYATETQGNPEYNAIDSASIEGAKTWKTKRGADNYLQRKVLVGWLGERIQRRWNAIEVVEIKPEMLNYQVIQQLLTPEEQEIERMRKILLTEIEDLQQSLQAIAAKVLTARSSRD